MRYFLFYLLSCVTLVTACQPVTPASIKAVSPNPKLTVNDTTLLSSALPAPSVPVEALSSGSVDQDKSQTEIDLAISAVTSGVDTQTNTAQTSTNITPQIVSIPKTFDPKKIIGFATQVLIRDLGKAYMVREEGQVEVWQYKFTTCVVNFFFYPIGQGASELIAKSWDMRSAVIGVGLDRDSCRAEMNLYHRKLISNS